MPRPNAIGGACFVSLTMPRAGVRYRPSTLLVLPGLALLVGLLALLDGLYGARTISPVALWGALTSFDPANFDHQILVRIRLPRVAAALLVGAGLGMSGLILQSLLRNPLGEPQILGLNAGASLAVVLTTALPLGATFAGPLRPLVAAGGGGLLFLLVIAMASAGRTGMTATKAAFCGIALSALASTLTSGILLLDEETLNTIRVWLVGDLSVAALSDIQAALPVFLLALLAIVPITQRLNILALGDAAATGLGVPVARTRLLGLTAAALLCGAAVSVAGPIGFVGLVVPALSHRLAGGDHRLSMPTAALLGTALLLLADFAGRAAFQPNELATGLMTAFVGAPVFISVVLRRIK
tara:strand:+ start:3912 stop:4976 length:1065 start_codon:yes stop_codon:yes gene_type:complete